MATKVGLGKILLAVFDGPTPQTPPPYRRKDLANISSRNRVITHFVPNFVAMAASGVNLNGTDRLAIAENHTLEPKNTTLSYTELKL